MPRVKILVSGKKGKLYNAVVRAVASRRGTALEAIPPGASLFEKAQSGSYAAVVFVLETEPDWEPVRWLLQRNPALPLVAVLPKASPKQRKELLGEGVSEIIEAGDLPAGEVRRQLHGTLERLQTKPRALLDSDLSITTDLHSVRSALTAILGNAELVLEKVPASHPRRKALEAIVQGVAEVETTLRRVERRLKTRGQSRP